MNQFNKHYKHIIFDWDGTLMDSTGRIVSAMQSTAENLSLAVPSIDAVKSIIGLSMDEVLDRLFPHNKGSIRDEILDEYRYQYVVGDNTPSPLFAGSLSLLNWLREQGITISVATGKARHGLHRVLSEVDMVEFFDFTICADEASSKPSPHMVDILN